MVELRWHLRNIPYRLNGNLRLWSWHISNSVDLFLSLDRIPVLTVELRVHFFSSRPDHLHLLISSTAMYICTSGNFWRTDVWYLLMLSPHILCNIYNGKFQISWHMPVCYMAFKMKGEVCRCFMLSGFEYLHLMLDLCEAGLCNPLDADSLFFWLIHSC